jgi:type VI secretion system secreted protein VgrG
VSINLLDLIGGAAGWRQNDRLLTLTTPAGADALLAETASIEEALGPVAGHAGFRIALTVLSANAHQSLTALLGQPARLELQTAQSRTDLRPFHGHISRVERLGANGGFARYRLTIEPWIAFLGHNTDNYLFQDKSVIEIVDELLGDWHGRGKLVPAWRWDLADAGLYPRRGMTVQHQESDLAFLKRLLAEEGLFCWFEHAADEGETLGRHTLVIADHNGAFADNPQAHVRYTQSGATLSEDSLDRWLSNVRVDTVASHAASWDYRSLSPRAQAASSRLAGGALPVTAAWHDPGQYAWQSHAHGERMTGNQRQAIDARLAQQVAEGSVRTAMPGSLFTLHDHPLANQRYLITAVVHHARNNLAERVPQLTELLGPAPLADFAKPADLYRNRIETVRADLPWRPLIADAQGRHIHPQPTTRGTLTAIVVGNGEPTHTDRDLRVRVQFPWQRGARAGARQSHPTGDDNAPASDALGVWLRVMTPVAGANWGGHLVPRPGQEVVVGFLNGNIDRPVIVGAVYNGQGQSDAQGNAIAGSTMAASANAPTFFAGEQAEPHTHGASLSGIKTQQLANTRDGRGGYNQLVFDDTPGQARIELSTTEYRSRLQMGHLREQNDNARLNHRGHGGDLSTQASAALRAGSGLLLSADARANASSTHLDSREPIARTENALSLSHSLAELAGKQNAALKGDPAADKLPAVDALKHAIEVLETTTARGPTAASDSLIKSTRGGDGTVPAWSEPRLQYSAPAGIAQLTPNNHFLFAGKNLSIAAGHDANLIAQRNHSIAVKDGIAIFTHGKSKNKQKPNQETGTHLHAASGMVSLQSQSGKTIAAADKKVTFASTHASLNVAAPKHVLLTAKGAYIKLAGGNIEVHAPGKVLFKASMKNWTGPKSASSSLSLPKAGELKLCAAKNQTAIAQGGATVPVGA